ncbi:MAG: hypothetical protein IJC73_04345 [Lentisphaeria bacterium]|nr:hypothetical protein [Lentisphaeria bacterium]
MVNAKKSRPFRRDFRDIVPVVLPGRHNFDDFCCHTRLNFDDMVAH